jgi:2-polyprenyl-3-methyl-5-hydroxy-6-metoxy-1,4-benzoquinol methylase
MDIHDNRERADIFAEKLRHEEYYGFNNKVQFVFNRLRIKHIVKICGDLIHARVLDVGIGDGFLAEWLHTKELWGIDISAKRCQRARERLPGAHILVGDVQALSISEMVRVVRPGGSVIVSVPNETGFIITRVVTLQKQLRNPDHIHNISFQFLTRHFNRKPAQSFNIPNIPYPLCIWQCYRFTK